MCMDVGDRDGYMREREKKVETVPGMSSISLRFQNARLFSYISITDKGFRLSWVSTPPFNTKVLFSSLLCMFIVLL